MTNKIWVTQSGMVHYRKPEQEAKEYVAVEPMPSVSGMGVVAESQKMEIPEGYALVPIEPTHRMIAELVNRFDSLGGRRMVDNYKAMIAAAPKVKAYDGWNPIETAPKDEDKPLCYECSKTNPYRYGDKILSGNCSICGRPKMLCTRTSAAPKAGE